jgi:single-strand DNA-binding protein
MFNATITGRLGTDLEMGYTDGGTPVVNVSIAHNWLYRDERLVKWIRCSIWGELAEKAMAALHKGDLVKVTGTITFRTWTRQDGTSVEEVELRASGFEREEPSGLTEIPKPAA